MRVIALGTPPLNGAVAPSLLTRVLLVMASLVMINVASSEEASDSASAPSVTSNKSEMLQQIQKDLQDFLNSEEGKTAFEVEPPVYPAHPEDLYESLPPVVNNFPVQTPLIPTMSKPESDGSTVQEDTSAVTEASKHGPTGTPAQNFTVPENIDAFIGAFDTTIGFPIEENQRTTQEKSTTKDPHIENTSQTASDEVKPIKISTVFKTPPAATTVKLHQTSQSTRTPAKFNTKTTLAHIHNVEATVSPLASFTMPPFPGRKHNRPSFGNRVKPLNRVKLTAVTPKPVLHNNIIEANKNFHRQKVKSTPASPVRVKQKGPAQFSKPIRQHVIHGHRNTGQRRPIANFFSGRPQHENQKNYLGFKKPEQSEKFKRTATSRPTLKYSTISRKPPINRPVSTTVDTRTPIRTTKYPVTTKRPQGNLHFNPGVQKIKVHTKKQPSVAVGHFKPHHLEGVRFSHFNFDNSHTRNFIAHQTTTQVPEINTGKSGTGVRHNKPLFEVKGAVKPTQNHALPAVPHPPQALQPPPQALRPPPPNFQPMLHQEGHRIPFESDSLMNMKRTTKKIPTTTKTTTTTKSTSAPKVVHRKPAPPRQYFYAKPGHNSGQHSASGHERYATGFVIPNGTLRQFRRRADAHHQD